ncbi:MAG TPA: response regulator [Candidatus Omnitrophota bacterium]|nr:response regulator [Candidatus Omnitrophota bacterium]
MWVNLSPYEKNRIIPESFGLTEMGRDLLAQDYILKQLTASLMYPEEELGKKFWDNIYARAKKEFNMADIPVDAFNKVWIIPEKAVVYEHGNSAFVVDAKLKVMLEEDYVASQKIKDYRPETIDQADQFPTEKNLLASGPWSSVSDLIRAVIVPEIEKEVNEGKHFANLRQIYNSMILAAWFKKNLKESLLGKVYVDQNKVKGIDLADKNSKLKIYEQYLQAFQKGVYNYIKEEYDPYRQEIIPKKYFSGGVTTQMLTDQVLEEKNDSAMLSEKEKNGLETSDLMVTVRLFENQKDKAITVQHIDDPKVLAPVRELAKQIHSQIMNPAFDIIAAVEPEQIMVGSERIFKDKIVTAEMKKYLNERLNELERVMNILKSRKDDNRLRNALVHTLLKPHQSGNVFFNKEAHILDAMRALRIHIDLLKEGTVIESKRGTRELDSFKSDLEGIMNGLIFLENIFKHNSDLKLLTSNESVEFFDMDMRFERDYAMLSHGQIISDANVLALVKELAKNILDGIKPKQRAMLEILTMLEENMMIDDNLIENLNILKDNAEKIAQSIRLSRENAFENILVRTLNGHDFNIAADIPNAVHSIVLTVDKLIKNKGEFTSEEETESLWSNYEKIMKAKEFLTKIVSHEDLQLRVIVLNIAGVETTFFDMHIPKIIENSPETKRDQLNAIEQKFNPLHSTILMVDDDAQALGLLGGIVHDQGYNIIFALDGVEALEKLKENKTVGLVMTDMYMPRMTGIELMDEMMADDNFNKIPVVMLTGAATDQIQNIRNRIGEDNYSLREVFEKPFDVSLVIKTIEDILPVEKPSSVETKGRIVNDIKTLSPLRKAAKEIYQTMSLGLEKIKNSVTVLSKNQESFLEVSKEAQAITKTLRDILASIQSQKSEEDVVISLMNMLTKRMPQEFDDELNAKDVVNTLFSIMIEGESVFSPEYLDEATLQDVKNYISHAQHVVNYLERVLAFVNRIAHAQEVEIKEYSVPNTKMAFFVLDVLLTAPALTEMPFLEGEDLIPLKEVAGFLKKTIEKNLDIIEKNEELLKEDWDKYLKAITAVLVAIKNDVSNAVFLNDNEAVAALHPILNGKLYHSGVQGKDVFDIPNEIGKGLGLAEITESSFLPKENLERNRMMYQRFLVMAIEHIENILEFLDKIEQSSKILLEPVTVSGERYVLFQFESSSDLAMNAGQNDSVGGIDLDSGYMDLQIKRDENGVALTLPFQSLDHMKIDGFIPAIINIKPIENIHLLLGF